MSVSPSKPSHGRTDNTEVLGSLRARIAELEAHNAQLEAECRRLAEAEELLSAVFEAAPYIVSVNDVAESRLLAINPAAARLTGRPREAWIGKTSEELFPPEVASDVRRRIAECAASRAVLTIEEHLEIGGAEFWMETLYIPVVAEGKPVSRVVTTSFDITARKLQQLAEREEQELIIERQSATLAELSTPLLAINEAAVVMPLVGAIDSRRASQILETLLNGIADTRARFAILDITGVAMVDTQVASALIRAAQAAKLLGTQVILTGIRPEVAQTLVGLGSDLGGVLTQANLQSGIALALGRARL